MHLLVPKIERERNKWGFLWSFYIKHQVFWMPHLFNVASMVIGSGADSLSWAKHLLGMDSKENSKIAWFSYHHLEWNFSLSISCNTFGNRITIKQCLWSYCHHPFNCLEELTCCLFISEELSVIRGYRYANSLRQLGETEHLTATEGVQAMKLLPRLQQTKIQFSCLSRQLMRKVTVVSNGRSWIKFFRWEGCRNGKK